MSLKKVGTFFLLKLRKEGQLQPTLSPSGSVFDLWAGVDLDICLGEKKGGGG